MQSNYVIYIKGLIQFRETMYFHHYRIKEKSMRIIYMGSAEFGIPALEKLIENNHSIVGVVSTPARAKGRGLKPQDSPISLYACSHGLTPVLTPESLKSAEFVTQLEQLNADLFVVVAFRILPKSVFALPKYGTVNIHASLLPLYRGPAPIQRAVADGVHESGVTVFRIDEGVDTGMVMVQKKTAVGARETTPELYGRLSLLGADALVEAINSLEHGSPLFIKQDATQATPAPKLNKLEGLLDWTLPAQVLFNRIRAFKPFPGTYTFLDGKRVGIEWAIPEENNSCAHEPGTICSVTEHGFDVQCNNSVLHVISVKPEGKKVMEAAAFVQGRTIMPGMQFSTAPLNQ
jgi:methionyl-tRNA formyltransferase